MLMGMLTGSQSSRSAVKVGTAADVRAAFEGSAPASATLWLGFTGTEGWETA